MLTLVLFLNIFQPPASHRIGQKGIIRSFFTFNFHFSNPESVFSFPVLSKDLVTCVDGIWAKGKEKKRILMGGAEAMPSKGPLFDQPFLRSVSQRKNIAIG